MREEKFIIVIYLALLTSWIVNLIQFFNCDFEPSYKEEIIHGVGIVIPPASVVTIWF